MKKSLAIQKRKQVQAHLNFLMQSLKQVEDALKDQIVKNDLHLAGLMSLDDKGNIGFPSENKEPTVSMVKETVNKVALQCEESLTEVTKIVEQYELHKRVRILLELRNPENQVIPTFSLFEDGFYSNWSTTENLSTTDRNLMLLSHLIFSILKRWNIGLKVKSPASSLFASASMSHAENRLPLPTPSTIVLPCPAPSMALTGNPALNAAETVANKTSSNANLAWGSAPVLSYSQVLNLPKPMQSQKQVSQTNNELPSFTFRFGQKGNGKFNVPSRFLGEILVRMTLRSHVTFIQQLIHFCRKPREVTRRIIKASEHVSCKVNWLYQYVCCTFRHLLGCSLLSKQRTRSCLKLCQQWKV